MNTLSRWILSILAVLGVGSLGYYAFMLSSQTLVLPFIGIETQYGNTLEITLAPPAFHIGEDIDTLLDTDAIIASLTRGGTVLDEQTLTKDYTIDMRSSYIRIEDIRRENTDMTPLILSADIYNEKRNTKYRLPKDFILTPTDLPRELSFDAVGDPREQIYNITLYGLGELTPSEIRYFVHYESSADCRVSSWGSPLAYETYSPPMKGPYAVSAEIQPLPLLSTPWIFAPISPEVTVPVSRDGQRWISQIQVPYDLTRPRVCLIAGVGGQYRVLEDRLLEDFSLTGGLLQALSPEYDMKSQVEFRFTHDIYSDVGALYSKEYISHRQDAKVAFLKSLSISPSIEVTPSDLVLTPERAILTLPLKEGEKYTISLQDVTDIYGRKVSYTYSTTLKSEPFLSLRLTEDQHIYTPDASIKAKLYTLLPSKNSYPLKLCRVNLETYARIERILLDKTNVNNATISDIMSSTAVSECKQKDIVLDTSGYVSSFLIDDFFPGAQKKTGMYILSFAEKTDTQKFSKLISPLIFSVVDTHLVLKVDASGKMMILATDLATGVPLPDQEITLLRNISRTHTEKWDPDTGRTDKIYLPLTTQSFATGIVIGRTDGEGYIDTKVDTLPGIEGYDSSPYGLSFESWWEYEGRYDSFLVQSRGGDRLGYLVSTWNDGITGYNFGIKDSDYSWFTRPEFTTYVHTDRRLYLPGETVHIHAILRKNSAALEIPFNDSFELKVMDPLGREIKNITMKPNEFGSIATDIVLPADASLGSYSINILPADTTDYVENGWGSFQVEVFKNPTFTASVELKSPDLENGVIRDLRKLSNTDPYNPWYDDVYKADFTIEGIVKAKYYNGSEIKNTPFSYRVYRSDYYNDDYWGNCFWGCYYEPPLEQYTEGTGSIDSDGYGIIRIPVEFSSFYSDYKYTVEVTIRDVLTGEEVTTPGSLVVKLPEAYKSFSPDNPLIFTPKKKILSSGESLAGEVSPEYGKWDASLIGKYSYEIIRREYSEVFVDDIRSGTMRMTTPSDIVVASGSILSSDFMNRMIGMKSGEYHMRISPVTSLEPPESAISDTIFYISGDFSTMKDSSLRVVPERTVYKAGEKARVMIQVPFTGSHLLITQEKGGVIDREYVSLTGNTLMREYTIDDTMMPNMYIGVVALHKKDANPSARTYAVGYGEIVTDITDKKAILSITPDKATYKNRDTVSVDLTLTDKSGNPLRGEVTMMVVDESLIRLLGNIDLDVLPKFYQKFPFTMKTALSAIGIERNRFLSRKGSNGGSGNKGGEGAQISSRTLFQNTAFYAPSIRTDISGKAKVSFPLPDNITDYRIITIANTQDSRFAVAEKTIEVRKDYVLEVAAPMIVRAGDAFTLTASAFNNTKRTTPAEIILTIGTGSTKIEKRSPLSLNIMERKSYDFSLTVPSNWGSRVSYVLELREKDTILDSVTRSITLPSLPIMTQKTRTIELFTGTLLRHTLAPPFMANADLDASLVDVRVSSSYADQISQGIASLLQYPYGCIEQTVSSTLPNRIALSLAEKFGISIDVNKAREFTKKGLEKILRMQHYSGGWVYWEGSFEANAHITPFVLRSLFEFRSLGEKIPQEVFVNGINYIVNNESEYTNNPDSFAEAVWTLALLGDNRALMWWSRIDTSKLSRHGYISYAYAAQKLGKYTPEIEKILFSNRAKTDDSWYWNRTADDAILAQLLLERQDTEKAIGIIDPLIRSMDLSSYYVSTQEKIQTLLALIRITSNQTKIATPLALAFRSENLIADLPLSPTRTNNNITASRQKIGSSYTLKRDSAKVPLYVTTTIQDRPKDITRMDPYSTGGISIVRTFELIDESRGLDKEGDFLLKTPVTNMTFQKGKLYKVTLKAGLPSGFSRHLSLEDFFPGGWRPINGIFKTEKSLMQPSRDSWWDYVESREDRLLANREYVTSSESMSYSYYVRPESIGEYLLPPATAYLMYRPEIHAYTKYDRVKVVQ